MILCFDKKISSFTYDGFFMKFNVRALFYDSLMIGYLFFVMVCTAGWLTHIYVCLKTSQLLLMLIGLVLIPAGIVHGIGYWFNFWDI